MSRKVVQEREAKAIDHHAGRQSPHLRYPALNDAIELIVQEAARVAEHGITIEQIWDELRRRYNLAKLYQTDLALLRIRAEHGTDALATAIVGDEIDRALIPAHVAVVLDFAMELTKTVT